MKKLIEAQKQKEKLAKEMMSKSTQKFYSKSKGTVAPPKLVVSPFVADTFHSRLNMIEILTLMSDYRKAYHMTHDFVVDFKTAE